MAGWLASSAGNTRGLIEAVEELDFNALGTMSSAGNTRGLIEAMASFHESSRAATVFRGEYPRPH